MKYIPYIYYILALFMFGACFKLMADSTDPVYFLVLGIVGSLVLSSMGILAQTLIDMAQTVNSTAKYTEFHTRALKHLTNSKRGRKG